MFKQFVCILAMAASVPAAAAQTRIVRFDDLNLSAPAGLERLERRIDGAARAVCGAERDQRQSLTLQAGADKCVAEAKARAMAQVAALETGAARGG